MDTEERGATADYWFRGWFNRRPSAPSAVLPRAARFAPDSRRPRATVTPGRGRQGGGCGGPAIYESARRRTSAPRAERPAIPPWPSRLSPNTRGTKG